MNYNILVLAIYNDTTFLHYRILIENKPVCFQGFKVTFMILQIYELYSMLTFGNDCWT